MSSAARVSVARPKRFSTGAMLILNAFGLFLAVPVVIAVIGMTLLHAGYSSLLLPFAAIAATGYILPFGLGNAYVTRLVRSFAPGARMDLAGEGFVVQVALEPRVRPGLRGVIEDADDIGYLRVTEEALIYEGDSIQMSAPFSSITQVTSENIGLRGLFICGPRVRIVVSGTPGVEWLEFAERASWTLPSSRRTARKLYERLKTAHARFIRGESGDGEKRPEPK